MLFENTILKEHSSHNLTEAENGKSDYNPCYDNLHEMNFRKRRTNKLITHLKYGLQIWDTPAHK